MRDVMDDGVYKNRRVLSVSCIASAPLSLFM